jgi:nascent polypeptide-associated complex subunit alpha
MIPGVNPRQMQQMMKQMGMSQESLPATKITIETLTGQTLVFKNPDVQKITMKGQVTFQLSGKFETILPKAVISISSDDIEMVAESAKVSKEVAEATLKKADGDIAQAIVNLTELK